MPRAKHGYSRCWNNRLLPSLFITLPWKICPACSRLSDKRSKIPEGRCSADVTRIAVMVQTRSLEALVTKRIGIERSSVSRIPGCLPSNRLVSPNPASSRLPIWFFGDCLNSTTWARGGVRRQARRRIATKRHDKFVRFLGIAFENMDTRLYKSGKERVPPGRGTARHSRKTGLIPGARQLEAGRKIRPRPASRKQARSCMKPTWFVRTTPSRRYPRRPGQVACAASRTR